MAILYVEEMASSDQGRAALPTGTVFRVDTEDFTAERIAVFDDFAQLQSFLKAWNGEANLDPQ